MYTTLEVEQKESVAHVALNRPEVNNAFNETQVEELTECFSKLNGHDGVSVIVLTGKGRHFCAGADLAWMQKISTYTREENIADSQKMARMFHVMATCPKPVVGRINGSAFGGGVGLVAVCDIAVCSNEAVFAFSEVKLGIVPAVISSYVIPKVGVSQARLLFLTGQRFTAQKAFEIGLVHEVCPSEALDSTVHTYIESLQTSGPNAMKAAKALIETWSSSSEEEFRAYTPQLIADLRASDEGREGIRAFLEKRKPVWR